MRRRVPNNAEQVSARVVERFGSQGVQSAPDDGNVCVWGNVSPDVREQVEMEFGDRRVGDGVQEGEVCFNWERA